MKQHLYCQLALVLSNISCPFDIDRSAQLGEDDDYRRDHDQLFIFSPQLPAGKKERDPHLSTRLPRAIVPTIIIAAKLEQGGTISLDFRPSSLRRENGQACLIQPHEYNQSCVVTVMILVTF